MDKRYHGMYSRCRRYTGFKEGDSINATGEKRETEAEPILGFAVGEFKSLR